jgi:cell division protein FtsZ
LINITGSVDLLLHEVSEAASVIHKAADEEANIIFGAVLDDKMTDEIKITVIATGFDKKEERAPVLQMPQHSEIRAVEMRADGVPLPLTQVAKAGASNAPGQETPPSLQSSFDKNDLDVPAFMRRKTAE